MSESEGVHVVMGGVNFGCSATSWLLGLTFPISPPKEDRSCGYKTALAILSHWSSFYLLLICLFTTTWKKIYIYGSMVSHRKSAQSHGIMGHVGKDQGVQSFG